MSDWVTELNERSKDDRAIIVGSEVRSLCVEIATLRAALAEARAEVELKRQIHRAQIAMTVARLGGEVEGAPTHAGNFLQRIDALRKVEEPAPPRKCACTHEAGDSPCPMHGMEEVEEPKAPPVPPPPFRKLTRKPAPPPAPSEECPVHAPPHEHAEGMNECSICDAPIPCAACGHSHLHGSYGCWGCPETGPRQHACMKYVKPKCTCGGTGRATKGEP